MIQKHIDVSRGDLVVAKRQLDPDGANVAVGERGVVFEEADGDVGPFVRWFSGGTCNVYRGDVERIG